VAQLLEALRYKPDGRGLDSQLMSLGYFHWLNSFGRTRALASTQPGIFPGGKGGRCVGLKILPPSGADCL
jgi:hypothetical protein